MVGLLGARLMEAQQALVGVVPCRDNSRILKSAIERGVRVNLSHAAFEGVSRTGGLPIRVKIQRNDL